jgi:pullulanase
MHNPRITSAYWIAPSTGYVLLSENWTQDRLPPLELASEKYTLTGLKPAPSEMFGEISGYYIKEDSITFFTYADSYLYLDLEKVSLYVAGNFNGWQEAVGDPAWKMQLGKHRGRDCFQLTLDASRCVKNDIVHFKFVTSEHYWLPVNSNGPNVVFDVGGIANYEINPKQTGDHCFLFYVGDARAISFEHRIIWDDDHYREEHPIIPGLFFYQLKTDLTLGSHIEENKTVFRVFAPRANDVRVEIFEGTDDANLKTIPMKLADQTTWEASYKGNLHGWYYYLRIDGLKNVLSNFDPDMRILDPYALATVSHAGPGIIWDKIKLPRKSKPAFKPPEWQDLVILEGHIRDLIKQAPITLLERNRLGFSGLTEWVKTADNYFNKLGINAVELQPIHQFDSDHKDSYHWGYMTTNYFSPSCWYAENPEFGSQISEFRELVDAFHEQGIAVILDVVYNHVGVPEFLLYIDKQYYFDTNADGELVNWSGCGNTLHSNAEMMQRLMIDSLIHYLIVYDVDGFRFDLAELIGMEVLSRIERELKAVKPEVILIAEPWSFRGHIGPSLKHTGYAFWNDGYRDFLVNYVKGSGDLQGIKYYISGCLSYLTAFPAQSVNYVESHDDFCWLDRITENPDYNGENPTDNDIARTHIMLAILMVSIGIPMIAAGQDMLRSKKGHRNTYQLGDINALDYDRIESHKNTHEYFANWIRFRLSDKGKLLRLYDSPSDAYLSFFDVHNYSALAVVYNADYSNGNTRLLFAVNPHTEGVRIDMHEHNAEDWVQWANHECFDDNGFKTNMFNEHTIELPPLSCGLWTEKYDSNGRSHAYSACVQI